MDAEVRDEAGEAPLFDRAADDKQRCRPHDNQEHQSRGDEDAEAAAPGKNDSITDPPFRDAHQARHGRHLPTAGFAPIPDCSNVPARF